MPAGRHRKTTPARIRMQRLGAPAVASLAVAAVVPAAAALTGPVEAVVDATPASRVDRDSAAPEASRAYVRTVSRSRDRLEPPVPALAEVGGLAERIAPLRLHDRWLTSAATLWAGPARSTDRLGRVKEGTKVAVTGLTHDGWAQVRREGRLVWLRGDSLAKRKPVSRPPAGSGASGATTFSAAAGVAFAPCPDGSATESGLTSNAIKVYRAVCAAFPAVSSWGGNTGYGDHGTGHALDVMCSGALGDAIANWVRSHAAQLGVSEVIWAQRIWTVQRGGEGWRYMSDRGSSTANHYDHVHVTVY